MNPLIKNQKIFYLIPILTAIFFIFFIVIIVVIPPPSKSIENPAAEKAGDCAVTEKKETVRGDSLAPIINPEDEVTVQLGYYNCREIKKNDIIAYNFAGRPDPVIKIIKAIPGDELKLQKSGLVWNILINSEILKTSKSEPYALPEPRQKLLGLYQGVIPENAYLILGNQAQGTLDSARFGLVHKDDILGRVKKIKYEKIF